jgi:predicted Fe-Mo cluster-binding NifX family protein
MRIAVTAAEKSLDSRVGERFGKSPFIFVADTENRLVRIIDNRPFAAMHIGSGAKTAEMLAGLGVDWVGTGTIGAEAFEILRGGGIAVATCATGTCREVLDRLAAGGLPPSTAAVPCRSEDESD